jgi:type IV secretory pathway VirB2 component (pilin)
VTFITAALASAGTFAQDPQQGWLVNTLYANGKINVVVAVVAVILAGLSFWMFSMDRRLRKMEGEQGN